MNPRPKVHAATVPVGWGIRCSNRPKNPSRTAVQTRRIDLRTGQVVASVNIDYRRPARLDAYADRAILNRYRAGTHFDLGLLSDWERENAPVPAACRDRRTDREDR